MIQPTACFPLACKNLLGAAACSSFLHAQELLGALDAKAARENRTIDMFMDEQRFEDVFARRRDVSSTVRVHTARGLQAWPPLLLPHHPSCSRL